MLKRDHALLILGVEALAIVGVVYYLVTLDLISLAWSASIAVAIPAWLLAAKAPTTCGVTTQNGGRCERKVNGVIFGCGRSNHTWAKFFARFGWRRQPDPSIRRSRSTEATEGTEVVTMKIAEDWKRTVARLPLTPGFLRRCIEGPVSARIACYGLSRATQHLCELAFICAKPLPGTATSRPAR